MIGDFIAQRRKSAAPKSAGEQSETALFGAAFGKYGVCVYTTLSLQNMSRRLG